MFVFMIIFSDIVIAINDAIAIGGLLSMPKNIMQMAVNTMAISVASAQFVNLAFLAPHFLADHIVGYVAIST